eukprot:1373524-Amphidinium_carterae.1
MANRRQYSHKGPERGDGWHCASCGGFQMQNASLPTKRARAVHWKCSLIQYNTRLTKEPVRGNSASGFDFCQGEPISSHVFADLTGRIFWGRPSRQ